MSVSLFAYGPQLRLAGNGAHMSKHMPHTAHTHPASGICTFSIHRIRIPFRPPVPRKPDTPTWFGALNHDECCCGLLAFLFKLLLLLSLLKRSVSCRWTCGAVGRKMV